MTDDRPIALPPLDLLKKWNRDAEDTHFSPYGYTKYVTRRTIEWYRSQHDLEIQAAADAELEACCKALDEINPDKYWSQRLRTARRPKLSNLTEEALEAYQVILEFVVDEFGGTSQLEFYNLQLTAIGQALERLHKLEGGQ